MADEGFARVKDLWQKCHDNHKIYSVDLPAGVVICGGADKDGENRILSVFCYLSKDILHYEEWYVIRPNGSVDARRISPLGKNEILKNDLHHDWFGQEVLEDEDD